MSGRTSTGGAAQPASGGGGGGGGGGLGGVVVPEVPEVPDVPEDPEDPDVPDDPPPLLDAPCGSESSMAFPPHATSEVETRVVDART